MKRAVFSSLLLAVLLGLGRLPLQAEEQAVPPVRPSEPLPQTLSPDKFDRPILKRAYAAAAKHREAASQLPCYCWCSRFGHRSLLDCFASSHGANCDICLQEILLVEQMASQGKKLSEIRDAIIHQQYRNVALQ